MDNHTPRHSKLYFVKDDRSLDEYISLFYLNLETQARAQSNQLKQHLLSLGYSDAEIREASRRYLSSKFTQEN